MRGFYFIVLSLVILSGQTISTYSTPIVKLYSDPALNETTAYDTVPGTLMVHVVLENLPTKVSGIEFKIISDGGFTGVWIGETIHLGLWRGTSPNGIGIVVTPCETPPIYLLTSKYVMFGTSSTCSYLEVVPDSLAQIIVICDCGPDGCLYPHEGEGGKLIINPDNNCIIPVERTSWGRIKAIYK